MYLKKITNRVRNFFYNHWIWKFSKFQIFSFPFLKFINFKITTNSFKYSLVEQFFETHFLKSNYRGKGVYFLKNLVNFFGFIYPPYLGCGGYIIRVTSAVWTLRPLVVAFNLVGFEWSKIRICSPRIFIFI